MIVSYIEEIAKSVSPHCTFWHGDRAEQNSLLEADMPLIFLDDPIYSDDTISQSGAMDEVYNLKILFANQSSWQDWTTSEHYNEVIEPMRELSRRFLIRIHRDDRVKTLAGIRRWNALNVLDINVSGIYLTFKISLHNEYTIC